METFALKIPRLSRTKALIAAGLASLAIAGTMQASMPESASAQLSQCMRMHLNIASMFYSVGFPTLGQKWLDDGLRVC